MQHPGPAAGQDGGAEGRGLDVIRHADRAAEHVGENLRPERAPGRPAGEDHRVPGAEAGHLADQSGRQAGGVGGGLLDGPDLFAQPGLGVRPGVFAQPENPLDFGNSGTGCRLVMGAVAGCPITAVFDGDASLRSRPMRRILDPLELMGAKAGASMRNDVDGGWPGLLERFAAEAEHSRG